MELTIRGVPWPIREHWLWLVLLAAPACRPPDNHVQLLELPVRDMERAVGFYEAVFEWEVSRPDSAYALLDATPVAIGLVRRDDGGSGGLTLVIATPDLELTHARVMQNGGVIRQSIAASWRGRQFRFADPDGNELVVWSDRVTGGRAP